MPTRAKKNSERSTTSDALSAEAYNHVVDSANLRDIKLITSTFYVQPAFFDERDRVILSVQSECTDCTEVENGSIVAFFSFEVKGRLNNDGDDEEIMESSAVYLAAYDVASDAQNKEASAFCSKVGLFAAYPYFRALVAHFAGDADLGIPALPLISSNPGASKRATPKKEKVTKRSARITTVPKKKK